METLNIVDLLEKNPVTRLSSTYNNKLINAIKETFTETQQKFFTSYFYCYLNYNQETDFVIDLDSIWEWLGFSQKSRATDLLEKKFILNKDYKHISNLDKEKGKGKGGHNKKTFMMTIKTFKLFCLKSGTEKADEICDYFIKMQELLLTLGIEQNNELRIQLEKLKNESKKINEDEPNKCKSNEDKSNNNNESNEDKSNNNNESNEDKTNNDETNNDETNNDETNNYESNDNECNDDESNDDESNDDESSNYQTNLDEYNHICKKTYNYTDGIKRIKELKREKKRLLKIMELNNINNLIKQIITSNKLLINKVENLEKSINKEILSKLNPNPNPIPNPINTSKTVTNFNTPLTTLGPRLQQINPDTLKLVKVYESVSELIAESNNKLKRPTINKAVVENTVYHGYRYLLVDRDLDANIITHIEPTKKTKIQNTGYIAQINKDKTEILNVYLDRKTAAKFNGHESSSALDLPVKNYTINHGHFYKLYEECEEDLREDFLIKNDGKEPFLYKQGVGRFDVDNNLVDEFACKFDCIKSMRISDKTLAKALESKQMYNNFYYRYLDSKLKC